MKKTLKISFEDGETTESGQRIRQNLARDCEEPPSTGNTHYGCPKEQHLRLQIIRWVDLR
jgi:hypothetical protein